MHKISVALTSKCSEKNIKFVQMCLVKIFPWTCGKQDSPFYISAKHNGKEW